MSKSLCPLLLAPRSDSGLPIMATSPRDSTHAKSLAASLSGMSWHLGSAVALCQTEVRSGRTSSFEGVKWWECLLREGQGTQLWKLRCAQWELQKIKWFFFFFFLQEKHLEYPIQGSLSSDLPSQLERWLVNNYCLSTCPKLLIWKGFISIFIDWET